MLKIIFMIIYIFGLLNQNLSIEFCQKSPPWRLNNYSFYKSEKVHIKLVALLKSSCGFCKKQAEGLGNLKKELENDGFKNISFLIVNSHEEDCIGNSHVFKEVTNLPVLQDISKVNVWKLYNGTTDDMLIYDKCNRLVNHLSMPDSYVHTGSVRKFVLDAYNNEVCGKTCAVFRKKKTG